jgi:hypothetical protein
VNKLTKQERKLLYKKVRELEIEWNKLSKKEQDRQILNSLEKIGSH